MREITHIVRLSKAQHRIGRINLAPSQETASKHRSPHNVLVLVRVVGLANGSGTAAIDHHPAYSGLFTYNTAHCCHDSEPKKIPGTWVI